MTSTKAIANIALRGATLASRFLFIFFLARFIEPSFLGVYGLFTTTVGYALYLVGLDFYTHSTREIIKKNKNEWGAVLKNQVALCGLLYLAFIPLLCLLFTLDVLPIRLLPWFVVILILEHINQELSRLFIAISEQLMSSVLLFIRQGSWALVIVAIMYLEPTSRTLNYVFAAWMLAGLSAAAIAFCRLRQLEIGGWHRCVNWDWILQGLKTCVPFLVATLALQGIYTLDRYWLEAVAGIEVVGAYVLFMGMASTLLAFLDAGVFAYTYPALIKANYNNQPCEFRAHLRKMLLLTIAFSILFSLITWTVLPYLLNWIGNDFYLKHQGLYSWLLLAMVINAISMVPHYALYAQGKDRSIIISHIFSVFVFIAATWLFTQFTPLTAIPMGISTAFAFILLWKSACFFRADGARPVAVQI